MKRQARNTFAMLRRTLVGSCLITLLTACVGLPSAEEHDPYVDPLETETHDSSVDPLETVDADSSALVGSCNPIKFRYSSQCWTRCELDPNYYCGDAKKAYRCMNTTFNSYVNEMGDYIYKSTGELGLTSVKCTWFPDNLDTCPEFCGEVADSE